MEITNEHVFSTKTIFEEIKERIKEKYHSQEEFAKEIGVSRNTMNRILNHGTDVGTFFKICKTLGIKLIIVE